MENIIGKTIRKLRRERRLTLPQLGELAGMHGVHIGRIERGVSANPSSDSLTKIARALGVKISDIMEGGENGPSDDVDSVGIK